MSLGIRMCGGEVIWRVAAEGLSFFELLALNLWREQNMYSYVIVALCESQSLSLLSSRYSTIEPHRRPVIN